MRATLLVGSWLMCAVARFVQTPRSCVLQRCSLLVALLIVIALHCFVSPPAHPTALPSALLSLQPSSLLRDAASSARGAPPARPGPPFCSNHASHRSCRSERATILRQTGKGTR